jgi:hypothetical protein
MTMAICNDQMLFFQDIVFDNINGIVEFEGNT